MEALDIVRLVLDFIVVPVAGLGWSLYRQVWDRTDHLQSQIETINITRMGVFDAFRKDMLADINSKFLAVQQEIIETRRERLILIGRLDRLIERLNLPRGSRDD